MPTFEKLAWARKVRDYLQRVRKLEKILKQLNNEPHKDRCPTDEHLQKMGIELSDLDIKTGKASPSAVSFFMPSNDNSVQASQDGINTYKDYFSMWKKMKGRNSEDECESVFWAFMAYVTYEFGLEHCCPRVKDHTREISHVEYEAGPQSSHRLYEVGRATKVVRKRQSHRSISMIFKQCADEDRPSTTELIVLVSWMLKAMYAQWKTIPKKPQKKIPWTFHVIFPTSVLSFIKGGRVRVFYGYFDEDKLRVQATKSEDFNGPGYIDMMNCALRWSFPILNRDTRLTTSLPTISEDENAYISIAQSQKAHYSTVNKTRFAPEYAEYGQGFINDLETGENAPAPVEIMVDRREEK